LLVSPGKFSLIFVWYLIKYLSIYKHFLSFEGKHHQKAGTTKLNVIQKSNHTNLFNEFKEGETLPIGIVAMPLSRGFKGQARSITVRYGACDVISISLPNELF